MSSSSSSERFRRRAPSDLEIDTANFLRHSTRAIGFTGLAVLASAVGAACYWRRADHIGNASMLCTVMAVWSASVHSRQANYCKSRMEEGEAARCRK